jgi:hypothetical protein
VKSAYDEPCGESLSPGEYEIARSGIKSQDLRDVHE